MKRVALMIAAVAAMLCAGASVSTAADSGKVNALSDLDGGAADYHTIYPHAGFDELPATPSTYVRPIEPAPNAVPQPPRADVPLSAATRVPAAPETQR